MGLLRYRTDSELMPSTELWVLFPDRSLRVDVVTFGSVVVQRTDL